MRERLLEILGIDTRTINWFPTTTEEEIMQNVAVLLTTIKGSVVLDRELGIDASFIDTPIPRGMFSLAMDILRTIEQYEPRVVVEEIEFVPNNESALDGRLYPRVVLRLNE